LVLTALAVAAIAAGIAAYLALRDSDGGGGGGGETPVHLVAARSYDPQGDGQERDDLVAAATDGNPATSWQTEHYTTSAFGNLKDGVGIVFDAGQAVALRSLTVVSDTPGFSADVKAGASAAGPFESISGSQTVGSRTTFSLDGSSPLRYYLVWITSLVSGIDRADVSEVTARTK
jgi:hypothetical protein